MPLNIHNSYVKCIKNIVNSQYIRNLKTITKKINKKFAPVFTEKFCELLANVNLKNK